MTGSDHHPAPHRDRLSPWMASLLLYTGPLAWFVQLNVGVIFTDWPCFPDTDRRSVPIAGYEWAHWGAVGVLVLCALIACGAGLLGIRKFREVSGERGGDHDALMEVGHGRTRFVALWAVYLGLGFAVATVVTLVAFLLVPPCLG